MLVWERHGHTQYQTIIANKVVLWQTVVQGSGETRNIGYCRGHEERNGAAAVSDENRQGQAGQTTEQMGIALFDEETAEQTIRRV